MTNACHVRLKCECRYLGRSFEAGEIITLDGATAARLIAMSGAEAVGPLPPDVAERARFHRSQMKDPRHYRTPHSITIGPPTEGGPRR